MQKNVAHLFQNIHETRINLSFGNSIALLFVAVRPNAWYHARRLHHLP